MGQGSLTDVKREMEQFLKELYDTSSIGLMEKMWQTTEKAKNETQDECIDIFGKITCLGEKSREMGIYYKNLWSL